MFKKIEDLREAGAFMFIPRGSVAMALNVAEALRHSATALAAGSFG